MAKYIELLLPVLFIGCATYHSVSDDRYALLMDDVTVEMTDPAFWLKSSSHPDRILMDENEISRYYGNPEKNFDILAALDKIDTSSLRDIMLNYYKFTTVYDKSGNVIDSSNWIASCRNLNLGNFSDKIRYAISVANGELRLLPTSERWYQNIDNALFDDLIMTKILINEPLVVLHESADGKWILVQGQFAPAGWIRKENVAFCKDKETWLNAQSGDFLLVTANRTRLQMNNPDGNEFVELTMGTSLKLVTPDSSVTDDYHRLGRNVYSVSFPFRNDDGELQYSEVFIPARNDMHVGYLPYTERNILNLAFSCLGDRYGWGGMFASRDCSSFVQDIYRCFGIKLPRNSASQVAYQGKTINMEGLTPEQKLHVFKKEVKIGSLLYFPGHVMIYLGVKNNKVYTINALSSLMMDGKKTYVQSVVVNSMDVTRANGKSWMESVTKCKIFQME